MNCGSQELYNLCATLEIFGISTVFKSEAQVLYGHQDVTRLHTLLMLDERIVEFQPEQSFRSLASRI